MFTLSLVVVVLVLSSELYEAGGDVVIADLLTWLSTGREVVTAGFVEDFDAFPKGLFVDVLFPVQDEAEDF